MSAEMDTLIDLVINGKIKEAKDATQKCLDAGISPQDIIFKGLSKAMEVVGDKYAAKQYFLPQVLLSANTLYQGLNLVLPMLLSGGGKSKGAVIIGVVEGDVHDIGKNICKAMLTGLGLEVVDMGKDVPIKSMLEGKSKGRKSNLRVHTHDPDTRGNERDGETHKGRGSERKDQDHDRWRRNLERVRRPDRCRRLDIRRSRVLTGRSKILRYLNTSRGLGPFSYIFDRCVVHGYDVYGNRSSYCL